MYDFNNLGRKNLFLVLLSVVMIVYTSILYYSQCIRGVSYWDIFVYLQNAMLFSHVNIGSQLSVPPVFSLIVSVPFSMGFVSERSMFVVAGVLFVFLVIGMYLLFNTQFCEEVSFVGSLMFSMFSLVVTWALTGATDVPALCFSVWALYFTICGLKRDFRFYYLALLFFVLAFFTRFTEGFIFIVMGFYLLLNFDEFKSQLNVKRVCFVLLYCVVIGAVICGVYLGNQGTIPFINQFLEVSSSDHVSNVNVGYDLNPFYYFQNLPEYLSSLYVSNDYFSSLSTSMNSPTVLSYVLLVLVVVYLCRFVLKFVGCEDDVSYKSVKVGLLIVLTFICIISYTHVSYMVTELLFIIILLLYYKWLPDNDNQLDYIMFLWIGIFIILHSYHPVKVDRYIIPILIPITYFICQSVTYLLKDKKKTLITLSIILILLIPVNASYISSITQEPIHTHEEKRASNFLKEYDPSYTQYNISSDRGVTYSWYLKKYTYTTIPRVLEANNESLDKKLNSIHAKYYIDSTSNTTNITGYHTIYDNNKKNEKIKIYERD